MSKTFSFSLNGDDQILFCTKYHCTTDNIGRVIKASMLDQKHSPYYREMYGEIGVADLVDKIKRSESYSTSDETKIVLKEIFGSYVETLKEFLEEKPHVHERVCHHSTG